MPDVKDIKEITLFGRILWVMVVTAGRSIRNLKVTKTTVGEIIEESKVVGDELQPLLSKLS